MYGLCYATGKYITAVSEQRLGKNATPEKDKLVNNIRAIVRYPPITILELLDMVFPVGSASRLYNEDHRPAEWN
jgi:hypothetical protein